MREQNHSSDTDTHDQTTEKVLNTKHPEQEIKSSLAKK